MVCGRPRENPIATYDDMHSLRDRIVALEIQGQATSKELRRCRDALHQLSERFETMTKADEIAQAVTTAITQQRRQRLTWTRKLAAGAGGVILLIPALHELFVLIAA